VKKGAEDEQKDCFFFTTRGGAVLYNELGIIKLSRRAKGPGHSTSSVATRVRLYA
jgi:hypothetical protein